MITRHKTDNGATNCRFRPKSAENGGPYHIKSQHCGRHTYNAKAGRDPALSIYTHISDRYAPFHATMNPPHGDPSGRLRMSSTACSTTRLGARKNRYAVFRYCAWSESPLIRFTHERHAPLRGPDINF
jgi:hypothetical protein